ncbi:hypothetical protein NSZ01_21060 [Nocardioides szechwanensis]|uniref:ARB-07466-like C-terminal domain-containing protein n=1 Tax=Nocardioides szechwanensis TaxID=1005944 RepID=A0A1H0HZJ1_9ACTN|nr:hypothetical protein [Nocardioides szechwanensis]GEP34338.1 hypothetical protein NSZ01_21060 [Nocardioides szechwanensis]SDO24565.1 hypothetical protein SAMN05192576_3628 [Nocardioides szechwanensis]
MADHRHKRDANARRTPRAVVVAGPLAFLATASVVTLGVMTGDPASSTEKPTAAPTSVATSAAAAAGKRSESVSRSGSRGELASLLSKSEMMMSSESTRQAIKNAKTRLWTATTLNLWAEPGKKARQVGEVETGEKVLVTGRSLYGREEIVLDGKSRWVTAGYLSAEKPEEGPTLGGACTNGSSVASGVSPNIVAVHQAVCANFPEITVYGTFRSDGEHSQGIAVDIMVSGDRGWEVAEFVRANYAALGVSYLIYSQNIWSVERSGEGWRPMSDRGSTTANHYDHVHVTTY